MADEGDVHGASEGKCGKMDSVGAGGALCRWLAVFHLRFAGASGQAQQGPDRQQRPDCRSGQAHAVRGSR